MNAVNATMPCEQVTAPATSGERSVSIAVNLEAGLLYALQADTGGAGSVFSPIPPPHAGSDADVEWYLSNDDTSHHWGRAVLEDCIMNHLVEQRRVVHPLHQLFCAIVANSDVRWIRVVSMDGGPSNTSCHHWNVHLVLIHPGGGRHEVLDLFSSVVVAAAEGQKDGRDAFAFCQRKGLPSAASLWGLTNPPSSHPPSWAEALVMDAATLRDVERLEQEAVSSAGKEDSQALPLRRVRLEAISPTASSGDSVSGVIIDFALSEISCFLEPIDGDTANAAGGAAPILLWSMPRRPHQAHTHPQPHVEGGYTSADPDVDVESVLAMAGLDGLRVVEDTTFGEA